MSQNNQLLEFEELIKLENLELNFEEIQGEIAKKIVNIAKNNSDSNFSFFNVMNYEDIVFTITEENNKTVYRFELTEEGKNKLKKFQQTQILKEILAEEINSKINFDSLNNAINIYNNSQKDESKKIELVKSFEDFINRREKLKIFSKSIEKIEKKEERKSKLKTEFDSLNNFQTTDIETIIKRYNLEDKFNTKIGNLKTHFEYIETIEKPKELDSIELSDEEKVKDKGVIDLIKKHRVKVIGVLLAGVFLLYNGENKKVESSYEPVEYKSIEQVMKESMTETEKIKDNLLSIIAPEVENLSEKLSKTHLINYYNGYQKDDTKISKNNADIIRNSILQTYIDDAFNIINEKYDLKIIGRFEEKTGGNIIILDILMGDSYKIVKKEDRIFFMKIVKSE